MGTDIRPEVSDKNKYHISKERYYELLHFCRQYPEWKEKINELKASILTVAKLYTIGKSECMKCGHPNPHKELDDYLEQKIKLDYKCALVEMAAKETDEALSEWLMLAVTKGYSYGYLSVKMNMPCGKNMFYDRYRKFFWILDKKR